MSFAQDLQACLEAEIDRFDVPALSIAVWKNGHLASVSSGVLNLDTGVEATTDSVFQIGSITKVMTACLIMQLVGEGQLELAAPVRSYLSDFQIADQEAAKEITVRQLLNHTSGIAGDFFPDDEDTSGNLIARFVDRCCFLPLVHPVGKMVSYSNTAFTIAGRLAEVRCGLPWATLMRERIFKPLGMTHAFADPKEAVRFRAAIGHVKDEAGHWKTADKAYLPLGQAPCGATPTMRPRDLIYFARAFSNGATDSTGRQLLSTDSRNAMLKPEVELPRISSVWRQSVALGWMVDQLDNGVADGLTVIKHGGATLGQLAQVQLLPYRDMAFAFLMNGMSITAHDAITSKLQKLVFDIDEKEPDVTESVHVDLPAYVGSYESLDAVVEVGMKDARLIARVTYKHDPVPPFTLGLEPLGGHRFASTNEAGERQRNVAFIQTTDEKNPDFFYFCSRLTPRRT